MKRIASALAAVVVAVLGTFAVVSTATAATDPEPHYATGEWQLRDFAGPYPDIKTSPASVSEATCDTVTLTKPDTDNDPAVYPPTGDGDIGTSYENTNLNLAVEAGDSLVVDYSLSDSANAAVGAVRMFVYDSPDADTINTPPTAFVAATDVTPSTLTIPFGSAMTIGTFGLTYDASNDTEGTVTFTNLELVKGDQSVVPIAFCEPTSPTIEPTSPPTTAPTTAPTTQTTTTTTTGTPTTTATSTAQCVDVNTATVEDLKRIIHIDDVRAADLVDKRPFKSVDDLDRVTGIGAERLADIKLQGMVCPFDPETTTTPAAGSKGSLPVTGAGLTSLIATAVLLLAGGTGVLLWLRRRRTVEG